MDLPAACGVTLPGGRDALAASTAELTAWLRTLGVPDAQLAEVERIDAGLHGFPRVVLRYGLVAALLQKGYRVPHDQGAWGAFEAAMRARLTRGAGP